MTALRPHPMPRPPGDSPTGRTRSGDVDAADLRSSDAGVRDRAWRAVFDAHYDRVYRLVCRFGVAPCEVEDLTQRVFLIAVRRFAEVEVRDPGAWLRGIAVRVVAQHRRWAAIRRAKAWVLGELPELAPAPVIAPDSSAAASEEMEAVREVLCGLSPKLRDALVLCDIEELSPAEAAALLRVSVNTVRSRRRLARDKFMQVWRKRTGGSM